MFTMPKFPVKGGPGVSNTQGPSLGGGISPAITAALSNAVKNAPKAPAPVAGPADKAMTSRPPTPSMAGKQLPPTYGPTYQPSKSNQIQSLMRAMSGGNSAPKDFQMPSAFGTPSAASALSRIAQPGFGIGSALGFGGAMGRMFKKGGKVSDGSAAKKSTTKSAPSASKRGDGIAQRGKTKGRMV